MPRTQGMAAPCLECRQRKLPEAGQAIGPDLFCAGDGPCTHSMHSWLLLSSHCEQGCCLGILPLSLCQSHETVEIPSILCLPVNGISPTGLNSLEKMCTSASVWSSGSPILHAPALMAKLPFCLIDIPINICRFLFLVEATAGWTS